MSESSEPEEVQAGQAEIEDDNLSLLSQHLAEGGLARKLLDARRTGDDAALARVIDERLEELRNANAAAAPQGD